MKSTSSKIIRNKSTMLLWALGLGVTALAPQIAQAATHASLLVADADLRLNIELAPPPPRHEVMVERDRPSRDHVWIPGYWQWEREHGRHVWVAGRWERPPHGMHEWVAPRWEHRGHSYFFVDGFWR